MDKEFILKNLKKEHLKGNAELFEVAELSGLDIVKELLRNHEEMRLYVPCLTNQKKLMREIIEKNKDSLSVEQLSNVTGMPRRKIKKLLADCEMKD